MFVWTENDQVKVHIIIHMRLRWLKLIPFPGRSLTRSFIPLSQERQRTPMATNQIQTWEKLANALF